jgi:hypothetical protein
MALSTLTTDAQPKMRHIMLNGVEVNWHFTNDRIFLEMTAPTTGWVTVGFNESIGITGAYLLMGRVVNNTPELVEHHTVSPGNYKPIPIRSVKDISGSEKNGFTTINFSLPIQPKGSKQKELFVGRELIIILAYSREDDFQHHSAMRTSIKIKL